MTEPPLTAPEAARLLGVSTARVRQLCLEGRFPGAVKTREGRGGEWLVPRAELSSYLTWRAMARAITGR